MTKIVLTLLIISYFFGFTFFYLIDNKRQLENHYCQVCETLLR